jgi:hypothetical protein
MEMISLNEQVIDDELEIEKMIVELAEREEFVCGAEACAANGCLIAK